MREVDAFCVERTQKLPPPAFNPSILDPGTCNALNQVVKPGISLALIFCIHLVMGISALHAQSYEFHLLVGPHHYPYPDGTNETASIDTAYGVEAQAIDTVIVADTEGQTIRKLTRVGTDWVLTTLAGSSTKVGSTDGTNNGARFSSPMATASDAAGNIYVADTYNNRVRKMSLEGTNWVVRTFPASAYSNTFLQPMGIAVDKFTNVYVSEFAGNRIQMVAADGTNWVVKVIAGSTLSGSADGTNNAARFNNPAGIALDRAVVFMSLTRITTSFGRCRGSELIGM